MTKPDQADHEAKMLARVKAEMRARERDRAQTQNGRLWGAWTDERLVCRCCGERVVEPERQVAFLDLEETFSKETIAARAVVAFDLMHRRSVKIPEWIDVETALLREIQGSFADHKPDEITMMATVQGINGRYGSYERVCDGVSHVFVRACPHCSDSDPVDLCAEFTDRGMAKVPPPHTFLDVLRADQESRHARSESTDTALLNSLLKDVEARPPIDKSPKHNFDNCPQCGSKTAQSSNFCTTCGFRLSA